MKKKYWQSFSELNNGQTHKKQSENEFSEDLPSPSALKKWVDAPASRRDFLKYLGFSTAAATAAASCEIPVKKVIPYVNKPENLVPGLADYYATTYINGGESIPIVAKVRDGRPIKIEGNSLSSLTNGATSARVQASVLDLYDTARLRFPIANGNAIGVADLDKLVGQALAGLGGAPIVLLTSTITSPSTRQIIREFLGRFGGSRHVQFDPISYSGLILAGGRRSLPSYRFDRAGVIVSLGADFLGTWLAPVQFARQYAQGRKIRSSQSPEMTKHYQFESMMSMTGANADERFTHRPSQTAVVAQALLAALNGQTVSGVDGKLKAGIEKAGRDLAANRGRALVVCGSNNVQVQSTINSINQAIGAVGSTIDWSAPLQTYQGIDKDMVDLVADMEGGRIGGLIVYDVNPAYEYFDAERFKKALARVKVSVSLNPRLDETTELCKFVVPASHFLESWGDAEPTAGYISLMQPTIAPLFKTRQFQESLLAWSGNTTPYETYFRNYWLGRLGSPEQFNKALQDGIIEPGTGGSSASGIGSGPSGTTVTGVGVTGTTSQDSQTTAATSASDTTIAPPPPPTPGPPSADTSRSPETAKSEGAELVIYQKVSMGEGRQANNPWLLELPDPITRATWDNYAMISPQMARELYDIDITKARHADHYEVHPDKPLINVKVGNKEIELPMMIVPGMDPHTIAVAVGFGRSSSSADKTANNLGRAIAGVGKNAYALLTFNGTTVDWFAPSVTYAKGAGADYKVAQVQTHSSYEGRHEVVKEFTLNEFKQNPQIVREQRNEELQYYGGIDQFEKMGTLYPVYDRPGIKWGMSIDLNSCIGCGACVVACNAENNIPVVGKREVLRFHDMHWMRIDRYFSGDPNDPESIQTIFQPMLCQHCDNAPCENVCPVAATNHNSEGINQMIYNRCIGTRYCANNCPFKVRRFNWADYLGADSFPDNQDQSLIGKLDDVVHMMNDDLTRMVLNPDVTVRSRGVIEKCSFCVQRCQDGKLKAKKENRTLHTGDIGVDGRERWDVKTACQEACPTNAIVFGNVNDRNSAISKARQDSALRVFYSLEQLHVLPNVNYLAKIRNTDVISAHHQEGSHDDHPVADESEPH